MKKLFVLLLFVIFIFSVSGCANIASVGDVVLASAAPAEVTEITPPEVVPAEITPLAGYMVIDGNELSLDEVEVVMQEDEERIAELGLNPASDMPNGYYINHLEKEKAVYTLTAETVYTFVDFNLLFVEDADGDRLYSTTDKDEFMQHLTESYTNTPPAQNVPFFIEVSGGNVISVEEKFLFTI